uniref:Uncharacterized protein n=1 Tax=Nelumbo nucifera TaxID=4432 RepID=A0A822YPJ0_NELNU|nr:TPA_asm: hypothetical protein HUJ06_005150 [Nelumbo nucifera]
MIAKIKLLGIISLGCVDQYVQILNKYIVPKHEFHEIQPEE